jgi:type VI secretion system secreted protein Hcp
MSFDTYLFIDEIEGESTAKFDSKPNGLTKAPTEIYSFSFGAQNPTTVGPTSGGSGAGRVSVSSFHLMKKTDNSSPLLFQACCAGDHFAKGSVVLRKAGGKDNKQQVFLQYDFVELYVDSVQWSGSTGGDDTPTESVSFSFGKVKVTNNPQDKSGKLAKGTQGTWDLRTLTAT